MQDSPLTDYFLGLVIIGFPDDSVPDSLISQFYLLKIQEFYLLIGVRQDGKGTPGISFLRVNQWKILLTFKSIENWQWNHQK